MAANKSKKLIRNVSLNILWLFIYGVFFGVVDNWLSDVARDSSHPMFRAARVWFDAGYYGNYPKFLDIPLILGWIPVILGWIIISVKVWFPKVILTKQVKPDLSNADELKKYADLRDQGIITEEEFQAKKKKLLDL